VNSVSTSCAAAAAAAAGADSTENHVASTVAEFYLDGEDACLTMTAKVRLYNRAVHLVLCEYMALLREGGMVHLGCAGAAEQGGCCSERAQPAQ